MDSRRFDDFTRLAQQSLTRRGILRSGLALVGIWMSTRRTPVAQAQETCGYWGAACDEASPCCDDLGLGCCDGVCVATGSDAQHCGACGNVCGAESPLCCDGQCIAPDAENCGVCGGSCRPCWTCDTSQGEGTCVFTCAEGEVCGNGACVTTCPPETVWCGGNSCVDLLTDEYHCGSCENSCDDFDISGHPVGSVCIDGTCQCPEGRVACTGDTEDRCVDLLSHAEHCGTCNIACAEGEQCVAGACTRAVEGERPDEGHPSKPTVPAETPGSTEAVTNISALPSTGAGFTADPGEDGLLLRVAGGITGAGLVAWLRRRTTTNDAGNNLPQP